jgi:23S rRNA (adenine2503-C2)-methyltransferase
MEIIKRISVPTGDILVAQGEKNKLEFLSLGDYGKDVNLKSHALNLSRPIKRVEHQKMLPLEEKWVITISTQYGCSMGCEFCDVPKVGPGRNVTELDLINQVLLGLKTRPEILWTKRLNIHFARMGEPTWNPYVLDAASWYYRHLNPEYKIHPVVSTIMPKHNDWLKTFIHTWMRIKNRMLDGNAGLQISINSTNEAERDRMFGGNALSLEGIAKIMDGIIPVGRKITLNFAVANYEIDPQVLLKYFNPELYICKLTPMHKTDEAIKHDIKTRGDYCTSEPYEQIERDLEKAGYDVLVFVASREEDESRITCGNAVLAL